MRAALIAVVLALSVLPWLTSSAEKANAVVVLCVGQSFSQDTGDETEIANFFWLSTGTCQAPVTSIGLLSGLYHYHWDSETWHLHTFLGGGVKYLDDYIAKSGTKGLSGFSGANCYANWTFHFATLDNFTSATSVSPTQCY
jgi:hypothetical protein